MTIKRFRVAAGLILALQAAFCFAETDAADPIVVVGSSTVFPFSSVVAEHFAKSGPYKPPLIRPSSTGEGFNQFCAGGKSPDIANASRQIQPDERARCLAHGIREVSEIEIGYDSLILARSVKAMPLDLSLEELWRAVAMRVPIEGRWQANPYRRWRDIAARLPDEAIRIYGPAPGHGTRDTLVTLVLVPNCVRAARAAGISPSDQEEASCSQLRTDGAWLDTDNLELTLGMLAVDRGATSLLTYSYLEQFAARIKASNVDGVAPSLTSIAAGAYPISRTLFMYVNSRRVQETAGLADYLTEFLSSCASGPGGYLLDEGLVPLSAASLHQQRLLLMHMAK
ncbi:MAG TPA: substrate-binding domain-containing protein [Steroidobacteraceae bacterium]